MVIAKSIGGSGYHFGKLLKGNGMHVGFIRFYLLCIAQKLGSCYLLPVDLKMPQPNEYLYRLALYLSFFFSFFLERSIVSF